MAVAGIVLTLGFIFGDPGTKSYVLAVLLAPISLWIVISAGYAVLRLIDAIFKLPYLFRIILSIIGMWIWSYLWLSSTAFDNSSMTHLEPLLLVPILCEVWSLALVIYDFTFYKHIRAKQ
jgi:hypothetical protein